jgi:hypothetical protein
MVEKLLSDRDLERLKIRARSTAQKDRVAGTGIPFIRIGRLVRYRPEDVERYLNELPTLRSTSEGDAALTPANMSAAALEALKRPSQR